MKNKGMAIPLVLGFILVATILGSSLLFLSRSRNTEGHRSVKRLQLISVCHMGLHEALAIIKPFRIKDYISKKGSEWKFKTSQQKYGKAIGWCEVLVRTHGKRELEIQSVGNWREKKGKIQKLSISCRARYKEKVSTEFRPNYRSIRKIEGEWKIDNFIEKPLN